MSLHLIDCVRPLRLNPSTKLALLAFADSADTATQIAFPGIDAVMEWASVSRSRSAAIVAELVDAGLLRRHRPGHRGRRAEFIVFPNGCCDLHPRPVDEDLVDHSMPPAGGTLTPEKGYRRQDSGSVKASRVQDPIDVTHADRVLPTGPTALNGSCLGPAHGTPSSSPTTTPQPPPAPPAGEPACAAHAPSPAPNCRGCATTPRARRKAAERAAALAARDARLAAQAIRAATPPPAPPGRAARAALAEARASVQAGR